MAQQKTINKHIKLKNSKSAITYKGVFDLKKLYEFLHDWLFDEGFVAAEKHVSSDDFESFYWQRSSPQGMVDYNIWWRMKKSPDEYNTKWFEYRLNIDFLGLAIAKTDVMHNGKKIGAHKGEINIFIEPSIVVDPQKIWAEDSFSAKFARTFSKRTFKKEIKYHKDAMEETVFNFQEAIKDFLGLVTLKDSGEPFHPEKGLGWG